MSGGNWKGFLHDAGALLNTAIRLALEASGASPVRHAQSVGTANLRNLARLCVVLCQNPIEPLSTPNTMPHDAGGDHDRPRSRPP